MIPFAQLRGFQICPILYEQSIKSCCGIKLLSHFSKKFCFLFVEVVQFLVHWLNEQLEILQTFLEIGVSPEPILSSANVVQRILDFVVAQRLPSVVLED